MSFAVFSQAAHSRPCRLQQSRPAVRLHTGLSSCSARREVALVAARRSRAASTSGSSVTLAAAKPVEAAAKPEAKAVLRYVNGSPFKVRRVLDQIRGRSYEEALMILEYMPYRACEPILKTLVSAAANAKQNLGMRKARLVVSECFADGGPKLKRFQPRAKGRAYRILKPLSHITIKVQEKGN